MESRIVLKYHVELTYVDTFFPILLGMTVLTFDHSANWCFVVSMPVRM